MIFISTIVGLLEVNCYILACEETREGIVIDPGDDVDTILQLIEDRDIKIVEIIATHGHFDHIGRVASLKEKTGAPFAIHKADIFMVKALIDIVAPLGLQTDPPPAIDRFIDEGDTVVFGRETLNILHVPGHAPGNIALTWPGHAIIGDTVFLWLYWPNRSRGRRSANTNGLDPHQNPHPPRRHNTSPRARTRHNHRSRKTHQPISHIGPIPT